MQEVCCTRCGVPIEYYDTEAGFFSNTRLGRAVSSGAKKAKEVKNKTVARVTSIKKSAVARATSIKKSAVAAKDRTVARTTSAKNKVVAAKARVTSAKNKVVAAKDRTVARATSLKRKTVGSTFKLEDFKTFDDLKKTLNSGLTNKELTQIGKLFGADKITFKSDNDTNFEEAKQKIYDAYHNNYKKLVAEQEAKAAKTKADKEAKVAQKKADKEAKAAKKKAAKAPKKVQVPMIPDNSYSGDYDDSVKSRIPDNANDLFIAIHPHHLDSLTDVEIEKIKRILKIETISEESYSKAQQNGLRQGEIETLEYLENLWKGLE